MTISPTAILVYLEQRGDVETPLFTGYHAAGVYGGRLVELCIIISQIGFCCAYLIFVRHVTLIMVSHVVFLQRKHAFLLPAHRFAYFSFNSTAYNVLADSVQATAQPRRLQVRFI